MGFLDDLFKTEEQRVQEAYHAGREEGRNAGLVDEALHAIGEAVTVLVPKCPEAKAHEEGYQDGLRDKYR